MNQQPAGATARARADARRLSESRADHRHLEREGRRRQIHRGGQSRRRARAEGRARWSDGRRHLRAEHSADDGRERAADGDQRAHRSARGARREGDQHRIPDRSRSAGDLARPDRHEDHHAVPARRRMGQARLLHRRHAAGHGRRAALARAGDAGDRGAIIVTTPQEVSRRRRAARREDVRARHRAGARHRREHELVRVSALRKAVADLRQWRWRATRRKRSDCRCSARFRCITRVLEGGDSGAPIVVSDPQSSAARALVRRSPNGVAEQLGALASR